MEFLFAIFSRSAFRIAPSAFPLPRLAFPLLCLSLAAEEIHLQSGQVLSGQLVEADKSTVVFRTAEGLRTIPKDEVKSIVFAQEPVPTASPPRPAENPFPPGFSASKPHRLAHVVTYRRITANKVVDEKKFEPHVVTISGDGSTIVSWSPVDGFWAMDADGSNRRRVLAIGDTSERFRAELGGRIFLSHDGKTLFWQGGGGSPIRRIQTDGTDERILVRAGAEYTPLILREAAGKIFFSQRGGIFAIDTAGRGDYQEIVTNIQLARQWEVHPEVTMLGTFDVSADGKKIAFVVAGLPRTKGPQLMAINADGTGLRPIFSPGFNPVFLSLTPDGKRLLYWNYATAGYTVDYDGSNPVPLDLPVWDGNFGQFQVFNRFSSDGAWFTYNAGESGGYTQITRLDGTGRWEPFSNGPFHGYENAIFYGAFPPIFSADLQTAVFMNHYFQLSKPRQVCVARIDPPDAPGLPTIADIAFPEVLSTNPQLPQHRGSITCRITAGELPIERVQFQLVPYSAHTRGDKTRWSGHLGWYGLQGDRLLNDEGRNGDAQAGDGLFSSDLFSPVPGDSGFAAGRYHVRILAHDERHAVVADVDGVEIK